VSALEKSPKANRGPQAGPANRAALIAAARDVFNEGGIDAPLSAVAKRAGVGQGSLYRHFPDRVSLALAVFEENMSRIEALAATPGTLPRDIAALVTDQSEGAAPFIEMLSRGTDDARVASYEARLRRAVEQVWPAPALGHDGNDEAIAEFLLALASVSLTVASFPSATRHDVAARMWTMLGRGISPSLTPPRR